MLGESKERLRGFVLQADRVEALPYFEIRDSLASSEIKQLDEGPRIEFHEPDDDRRYALLFNLRPFVEDTNDFSIGRLCELYDDPGVSDAWKDEHRAIWSALNSRLEQVAYQGARGSISYREVFWMFLHGSLGHSDDDDHSLQRYRSWVSDQAAYRILHNTFDTAVTWILAAVVGISRASRVELAWLDDHDSR